MQTKKAMKWSAGKIPDYDALLASARAKNEAERLATHAKGMKEQAVKRLLPPLQGEGKYDARVVQALVEILTGRPTQIRPQKIEMPETIFERIVLVLSSTEQFYYRVTESSCTCKGWHYSMQRYGIGKCRHHTLAFPEIARENARQIEQMKAQRTGQVARKATASSSDSGEPLMSDDEKAGFKPFLEF